MRKSVCILFATLIFLLTGCNVASTKSRDTAVFYYIHNELKYGTESGVIASTVVNVKDCANSYHEILDKYFNGPTNYDCISPFPAGISLVEFQFDGDKAQLLLSPHMATLSGSALTVALACLTRTVIEITNAKTVQVKIQDNQINGSDALTLTLNSFSDFDSVEANSSS